MTRTASPDFSPSAPLRPMPPYLSFGPPTSSRSPEVASPLTRSTMPAAMTAPSAAAAVPMVPEGFDAMA
jgi:hypothetical protein